MLTSSFPERSQVVPTRRAGYESYLSLPMGATRHVISIRLEVQTTLSKKILPTTQSFAVGPIK